MSYGKRKIYKRLTKQGALSMTVENLVKSKMSGSGARVTPAQLQNTLNGILPLFNAVPDVQKQ
jgi:hypothetical protein